MAKAAPKKANTKAKRPVVRRADEIKGGIDFHFIKSQYFRVIAVDGAWGGLAPNGRSLRIAIFNDRLPLPERIKYGQNPAGLLSAEIERDTKLGVVREVEAELVMDLDAAERFATWLTNTVAETRARLAAQKGGEDE